MNIKIDDDLIKLVGKFSAALQDEDTRMVTVNEISLHIAENLLGRIKATKEWGELRVTKE